MGKIKVLCVTDYYLPAYKAGGPIRTIANMSDILAGKVEFTIIARDRDLGDDFPFENVQSNKSQIVSNSSVYYASPRMFGAPAVKRVLSDHQVLYLNSFFSIRGSIWPYLRFRNQITTLIAPRGEFSQGALAIKYLRKRLFIRIAKFFGLYRDVQWHASTALEARDIQRVFGNSSGSIHLAIDPVALASSPPPPTIRERGQELRVIFISRISPKKNLDGLVRIISKLNCATLLTIYGPIEERDYWEKCQSLISNLPKHINVNYGGALHSDDVSAAFAEHDVFAFPTLGENFGHVIFESLRAGTPVLLSDQTPWETDLSGAVTELPLDAIDEWRIRLEGLADMTDLERQEMRTLTLNYAHQYALSGTAQMDNMQMFMDVVK